jgi:hypothetical protein
MPWTDTGAALKGLLEAVVPSDGTPLGTVYLGDKHVRDWARIKALFTTPESGKRDLVRGWRIVRESISEKWWSVERTQAVERYVILAIQGLTGDDAGEGPIESARSFQRVLDDVRLALEPVTAFSDDVELSGPNVQGIGFEEFSDVTCHVARIEIDVTELYTIVPQSEPAGTAWTAATRARYDDVAQQILAYLDLAGADAGNTYFERPFSGSPPTIERRATLFEPAVSDEPGQRRMRAWQVFRGSDNADRQLANRVSAAIAWSMLHHRAWKDDEDSYDATQQHVDQVRAIFRGVGSLGNPANPTQSLNAPLQIKEIGARSFMSVLAHFVGAELPIEEVAHEIAV